MINCNICGGPTTIIEVKEQMMGTNELFTYHQCINCGHTHLAPIPQNLSKYYNTNEYYSFKTKTGFAEKNIKQIFTAVEKILVSLDVKNCFLYSPALKSFLSENGNNRNANILDYGCGAGQFVKELNLLGFANAKGFDPFLPKDESDNDKLLLTNKLESLKIECWDVITLNHVFEHLNDPVNVLQRLNLSLCAKGKLLLRFPIIDSYAFEKYRENWVQFDAPRHLNLFTRKSIQIAVEKAGNYKILDMKDDSYHFQFTGSELYLKKLSLKQANKSRLKRLLSLKTYHYHLLAKKLNKQTRGDQMMIALEKI